MNHNLSDLALLGVQLHNYHAHVNDPIWAVGSAFFSDKRALHLEARALGQLKKLVGNPNFDQVKLRTTINRLRRVMRSR